LHGFRLGEPSSEGLPSYIHAILPVSSGNIPKRLLVVLVSLVVNDVEELELVDTLGGGDDTEPVTELLLLEELLGPANRIWSVFRSS
jgi:hypothetical protein